MQQVHRAAKSSVLWDAHIRAAQITHQQVAIVGLIRELSRGKCCAQASILLKSWIAWAIMGNIVLYPLTPSHHKASAKCSVPAKQSQ